MSAEGADVGEYCDTVLCAKTYYVDEQFAVCTKEQGHEGVHEGGDGQHRYLWSNRERFYTPEYQDESDPAYD